MIINFPMPDMANGSARTTIMLPITHPQSPQIICFTELRRSEFDTAKTYTEKNQKTGAHCSEISGLINVKYLDNMGICQDQHDTRCQAENCV